MEDTLYNIGDELERRVSEIARTIDRNVAEIGKIEIFPRERIYMSTTRSAYPPLYLIYTERVVAPVINILLQSGGQVRAIDAKEIDETVICSVSSEMKKIARVLIAEDGALEILFMLASEGPLDPQILTREIMPANGALRTVSELSKCGLVEVVDGRVTLTSRGENLILNVQTRLGE